MKLFYNGVDLATLGTLRVMAHSTVREPAEAPQRERVTYKVRLDFFEQSFQDNFGLIEQVWAALKTQNATLLWQDDNGSTYLERAVTAGDDESTDDALQRGGTYWQALVIHFWFYNHDVVTNCLAATFQRSGTNTPLLTFSTVEKFGTRLNVTRFDELRSARKLVTMTVSASGRLQASTADNLETRRTALQALKQQIDGEIAAAKDGTLTFGTFNQVVRVTEFHADIDQPNNFIAWSLTGTFTLFPDEADYAMIDLKIQSREVLADGIKMLTLSGKVGALTAALATARLNTLKASLIPSGYVTLVADVTEPRQQTESAATNADQGDGPVFVEIQFTFELRDASSLACTYQPSGANKAKLDLGTVDKFTDSFNGQLFDEMRALRKRASGTIAIGGKWYVADALSDSAKTTALIARKAVFDAALLAGTSGTLVYTTLVNQVVRVIDFHALVNRLRNCIEWNLTATFTRFPNEANYAVCEIRVGTKQDRLNGVVIKTLAGRIGAQSPEAAIAKLAVLRTQFIPTGFVLKTDNNDQSQVSVQSDGKPSTDSFIELTINEEWQQQSGNVLSYKLRRTDEDDFKSGWLRTTFSGTVQASGASAASAFATAEAQALALGGGKYPFLVRTSVVEISNLVLTDGSVIVQVEFIYEYQQRGSKIYTDVTSELNENTFGDNVETVSGSIAAPTLALALATYTNDVRNVAAYSGALLVNERRPTLSQQRLDSGDGLNSLAALDDRYVFSFQVLHPKNDSQLAIAYSFKRTSNLQLREQTTEIEGMVQAASEAAANAFLDTFLTGLGLGVRLTFTRTPHYQQGSAVSGASPATVMMSLSFSETYVDLLAGIVSGILESECTAEVTYSGNRLVVKGIPDGPPIIQKVGTTEGRRVVTARAIGTTESACQAWVRTIRLALLSTALTYEEPPKVGVVYRFLPQTAGVPVGDSNNVKLFEVTAQFTELLTSLPFS